MELERRSSGVAKGGLATGVVGTSLGALNTMALLGAGASGLGNLFGRTNQPVVVMENAGYPAGGCCSEDHYVNRYELQLEQSNAAKDSEIALLKANTYNDQKSIELYKYIDGELKSIRNELAAQAVINQKTADSFVMAQKDLQCCCDKMDLKLEREIDERKCADNTIITYTNATFYPIKRADVAPSGTYTDQKTYNPLPCGDCCGRNN